MKNKIRAQERSAENDLVAFQKWTVYVKGWLTYVVAYSFCKNYSDIMNGEYSKDLFEYGYHKYSIKILKNAMKKFVFNDPSILKLELAANKIISGLLSDFIYAVIHMDEDGEFKPSKTDKKFINIISENLKSDYKRAKKGDEAYNLYLRFLMVADYVSGMTDSFAKHLYRELNGIN